MASIKLFESDHHKKSDNEDIAEICHKSSSHLRKQADMSDDCDIIPPTPTADIKKKKSKKKRMKHKDTKENRNKLQSDYLTLNFECEVQSTRTGTFDFNKPYMYHSIEEVLKYTDYCMPKNNNIHLIGVYKFNSQRGHNLTSCFENNIRVALDLVVVSNIPNEGEIISVFGSIEIRKNMPVLVVKFFRCEVKITISKYVENLRTLRNFIPTEYFKIVTCSNRVNIFSETP